MSDNITAKYAETIQKLETRLAEECAARQKADERARAAEQLQHEECLAILKLLDDAGVPRGNVNDCQGWDVRLQWLIQKKESVEKTLAEMRDVILAKVDGVRDVGCFLNAEFPATVGNKQLESWLVNLWKVTRTTFGQSYIHKSRMNELLKLCADVIQHYQSVSDTQPWTEEVLHCKASEVLAVIEEMTCGEKTDPVQKRRPSAFERQPEIAVVPTGVDTVYKLKIKPCDGCPGVHEVEQIQQQLVDERGAKQQAVSCVQQCAHCGEHKPTPYRRDELGGYVCLACVEQHLNNVIQSAESTGKACRHYFDAFTEMCEYVNQCRVIPTTINSVLDKLDRLAKASLDEKVGCDYVHKSKLDEQKAVTEKLIAFIRDCMSKAGVPEVNPKTGETMGPKDSIEWLATKLSEAKDALEKCVIVMQNRVDVSAAQSSIEATLMHVEARQQAVLEAERITTKTLPDVRSTGRMLTVEQIDAAIEAGGKRMLEQFCGDEKASS
jgi:hypothetical protein